MRISDWSSDVCSSDLSTCQRAIRSNSQKLCVLVAAAILRKPRLTPSASNTFIRPIRSLQGAPVRRCVNASENPVRSSTSSNRSVILAGGRSEEHTSELQSLMSISYAVFCLKKKKTKIHPRITPVIDHTQCRQPYTRQQIQHT